MTTPQRAKHVPDVRSRSRRADGPDEFERWLMRELSAWKASAAQMDLLGQVHSAIQELHCLLVTREHLERYRKFKKAKPLGAKRPRQRPSSGKKKGVGR